MLYPLLTTFVVMATANHYLLDAAGGVVVVAAGFFVQRLLAPIREGGGTAPAEDGPAAGRAPRRSPRTPAPSPPPVRSRVPHCPARRVPRTAERPPGRTELLRLSGERRSAVVDP